MSSGYVIRGKINKLEPYPPPMLNALGPRITVEEDEGCGVIPELTLLLVTGCFFYS
jgi:hypothetical protein